MYQEKKHLWLQRLFVIFLALVIVMTYMPTEAFCGTMANG